MPNAVQPALVHGAFARVDQPVLTSAELILRPWHDSDVADVIRAYSQPDIQHWHARSMEQREAEGWIRARSDCWHQEKGVDWAVTDGDGVLGRVGLRRIDHEEALAEVVYWVLPEARGRGVATRALCALSDWAFDAPGFHRLELTHSTENLASCRVAQSALYELEGTKRQEVLHADGWHDMHLHSRLSGDPRPDLPTRHP